MKQRDLKKRRLAMGLTQQEAADLLGLALRTYTYWESCKYKISELKLRAISTVITGK